MNQFVLELISYLFLPLLIITLIFGAIKYFFDGFLCDLEYPNFDSRIMNILNGLMISSVFVGFVLLFLGIEMGFLEHILRKQ